MSRQLTTGVLGRRKVKGIKPNYIYGLLYNGFVVFDERLGNSGFAPPTGQQNADFFSYIDATYNVAPNDFGLTDHIKSCRQVNSPLGGDCATEVHPRWNGDVFPHGRDTVNYSFLPGGIRSRITGLFSNIGARGYLWDVPPSIYLIRFNTSTLTGPTNSGNQAGISIRLCKEATPDQLLLDDGVILPDYYKGNNDFLYDCVKIDNLIWLKNNLAETKWNDNTDIPFAGANGVNFDNAEWLALTTPARCAYDNDTETWAYTL